MKGAVFIALNDFVEEKFGIAKWEAILTTAKPASGGIYTSVKNYDDAELLALVHATCTELNIDRATALKVFGSYLFDVLNHKHPIFTKLQPEFITFLASVEPIVHKEVRKLFPDIVLPSLTVMEQLPEKIVLKYISGRKMCELAEGLIAGAANFYATEYQLRHPHCYHQGHDHCLLEITLMPKSE